MFTATPLEQKLLYEKDFPIQISLMTIQEYPLHFHRDLEILYVLRGTIQLKNGSCLYSMGPGSIFACNKNEVHGIFSPSEDNVVAFFHLQGEVLSLHFPELLTPGGCCLRTLSEDPRDPTYNYLQKQLLLCIYYWLKKAFGYKAIITNLLEELLPYLNDNFNYWIFNERQEVYWKDKPALEKNRLRNVIRYVYAHFDKKLTLDDLSYQLALDPYYLSHLVKKDLGISFRELVMFARVEMADQLLLGTNLNMTEIRRRVAISTTDYFEKHFRRWYHCSPEEYRAKYQAHTILHAPVRARFTDQAQVLSLTKQAAKELSLLLPEVTSLSESIVISLSASPFGQAQGALPLWAHGAWTRLDRLDYPHKPSCRRREAEPPPDPSNYLWDSVAAPVCLLAGSLHHWRPGQAPQLSRHQDPWNAHRLLCGQRGLFTGQGLVKPAYFAHWILARLSGGILYRNSRTTAFYHPESGRFSAIFLHYDDALLDAFLAPELAWSQAAQLLDSFAGEREILLKLEDVPPGIYLLRELSMSHARSLFSYLSKHNAIDRRLTPEEEELAGYFSAPALKEETVTVSGAFSRRICLEGTSFCALTLERTQANPPQ